MAGAGVDGPGVWGAEYECLVELMRRISRRADCDELLPRVVGAVAAAAEREAAGSGPGFGQRVALRVLARALRVDQGSGEEQRIDGAHLSAHAACRFLSEMDRAFCGMEGEHDADLVAARVVCLRVSASWVSSGEGASAAGLVVDVLWCAVRLLKTLSQIGAEQPSHLKHALERVDGAISQLLGALTQGLDSDEARDSGVHDRFEAILLGQGGVGQDDGLNKGPGGYMRKLTMLLTSASWLVDVSGSQPGARQAPLLAQLLVGRLSALPTRSFDGQGLACALAFTAKAAENNVTGADGLGLALSQVVLDADVMALPQDGPSGVRAGEGSAVRMNWREVAMSLNALAKLSARSPALPRSGLPRRAGRSDAGPHALALRSLACAAAVLEEEGGSADTAAAVSVGAGGGELLDAQAVALICGAVARSPVLDTQKRAGATQDRGGQRVDDATLVWRMAWCMQRAPDAAAEPRHAANVLNALAFAEVRDVALAEYLVSLVLAQGAWAGGGIRLGGRGSVRRPSTTRISPQALSLTLHALARLNLREMPEQVEALQREVLASDWHAHTAAGLANIAWAVAVLPPASSILHDMRVWVLEALHYHTAAMDRDSLQAIQQFLLDCTVQDAHESPGFAQQRSRRLQLLSVSRSAPSFLDVSSLSSGIQATGQAAGGLRTSSLPTAAAGKASTPRNPQLYLLNSPAYTRSSQPHTQS